MKNFLVFVLAILLHSIPSKGQMDSTMLSFKDYIGLVLDHHPLAQSALLNLASADAELLKARGSLDPEILSNYRSKTYDSKSYYEQFQAKLIIPTPLGINFLGGFSQAQGDFLNPEYSTDPTGLWNFGFEANLIQGLFVNERLIGLKQARLIQDMAVWEQELALNDLILEASLAYLEWQKLEAFHQAYISNSELAKAYFLNTKSAFFAGEKTAMDTLESYVLWQDAEALLMNNQAMLTKTRQNLENFLWFKNQPVLLQEMTQPEAISNQEWQLNYPDFDALVNQHPSIQLGNTKINRLNLEQRWKREKLKPKLKLKYTPLSSNPNAWFTGFGDVDNLTWALNLSIPILMRTERAEVQQGEIKINQASLDLELKRTMLRNKLEASWNNQLTLAEQAALIQKNVIAYERLYQGERKKFDFGESSVFLITKRQEKLLQGKLKLIETQIKQEATQLDYLFLSNQLVNQVMGF